MNQEQLDQLEAEKRKSLVNKHDVLTIIKRTFDVSDERLFRSRSKEDQSIIGNLLTVLEMDLKRDIKELPETK